MTGLADAFLIMLGSALGGMARYALVVIVESRRDDARWPLGTLLVNLLGCLLLGFVVSASLFEGSDGLRIGLIAGLGSFTTVSAFVLESWQRRTHPGIVLGYGLVTVVGCVALFRAGALLA